MTRSEAMQLALDWAARGVPAFPVVITWDDKKNATNKVPMTTRGFKDASTSPSAVRLMFNKADPGAGAAWGVGLHPGPAGYVVLDLDDKGGRNDTVAVEELELPPTFTVFTASGGQHRWLRKPKGATIGNTSPWEQVAELRADDGFVIAPGVFTPWGSWETNDEFPADVVDVPDRLARDLPRGKKHVATGSAVLTDDELDKLTPADREALEHLSELGWHYPILRTQDGRLPWVEITRPGKTGGTPSASIGYVSPGVVHCFTDAVEPFKPSTNYVWNDDEFEPADTGTKASAAAPPAGVDPATGEIVAAEAVAGADGLRYTDAGNATRLIKRHGDKLRFVATWGCWLVYDRGHWRRDPATTLAANFARQLGTDLLKLLPSIADGDERARLVRWATRSENAPGIDATLRVARTVPGVAIMHDLLDANPWLFNVTNGTVDLTTGELRPHQPADLLTMKANVAYAANAAAPEWEAFLERVLPDPEVRRFVQRIAGLALVGEQLEHVLAIALGGGANGKSTFTKVIAKVLGDYAVVASRDLLVALKHDTHPTAKAGLFRARFAHSGEIPPGAHLDEAQVKELTGGDKIQARRMREDFWEFDPSHLLWLHANHRPQIDGTDDGIWRRIMLIPFDVQIPEGERDAELAKRIVRGESAGVLNWMLAGLAAYRAEGLNPPAQVVAATRQYRTESDTVAAFLAENDITLNAMFTVKAGDLMQAHTEWWSTAGVMGSEKAHYQRVVDDLKSRGATLGRTRTHGRFWRGVGFLAADGSSQNPRSDGGVSTGVDLSVSQPENASRENQPEGSSPVVTPDPDDAPW